jgi:hypothetical protein
VSLLRPYTLRYRVFVENEAGGIFPQNRNRVS